MSRTGHWLLALAGALALATLVAWLLHTYERVERHVRLPPQGEAAYNPLYALRRILEQDGLAVVSSARLEAGGRTLGAEDTLLLLDDPRRLNPVQVGGLLDWVQAGGHLVLRTPLPAGWDDDLDVPILHALGVLLSEEPAQCEELHVPGADQHIEFCNGRRFFFDGAPPAIAWGDLANGYVHARLAHGQGQVDVLADLDFLTNGGQAGPADQVPTGGLRDRPHRALARLVLAPNYGQGTMHLVYAAQMPSLVRTVVTRGWPVWLPLLLAVLGWLWLRAQRFGPQRPPPPGERRSLLEHVRASGEHLGRYRQLPLLHAALRRAFLLRLRRRDPVAAALEGEVQVQAIATRVRLPSAQVRRALQPPAHHDKAAFRDRASTLVQMRNRL